MKGFLPTGFDLKSHCACESRNSDIPYFPSYGGRVQLIFSMEKVGYIGNSENLSETENQ